MEELFFSYFPLGIAHKNALVSFVFSPEFKNSPIKSAFWKFFLIIFPQTKEKTLLPDEWMSILKFNRDQYEKIEKTPKPPPNDHFKDIILQGLAASFMQSTGSIKIEALNGLSNVLYYFLNHLDFSNGTISNNITECICFLAAKFYVQFVNDHVENNDSTNDYFNYLLSEKYIFHDIFACLRASLVQISSFLDDESPLFASQNQRLISKALSSFNINIPISLQDTPELTKVFQFYRTIFWVSGYSWNEISQLASLVFSQYPDNNIFHLVYAWIISNGKSTQNKIDIPTMIMDIGQLIGVTGVYCVNLQNAVSSIQKLEALIENNYSDKTRYIVQQHMKMLSKYISGKIRWEVLIPIEIYNKL